MPANSQPNILFIFTDQHRLSAVSCYGPTPCKTPNIDRLAAEGIRFETAYTVTPVCSPARGTIMTGLYPHKHGVCVNLHEIGCPVSELADSPGLLSRRLQGAGYQCGYSGKWHLGTASDTTPFGQRNMPVLPKDVGFEGQNFPGHGGGGFHYPEYKQYLEEHGFEHKVIDSVLQGPLESTVPYFLASNTINMMDEFSAQDKPFFIWHNFWGPHGPYFATQEFNDIYKDVPIPPWPSYEDAPKLNGPQKMKTRRDTSWDGWQKSIRHYYAFATMIDNQIGRMIHYLEEKELLENTVIVFTSDHGETLGCHGGMSDKGWSHYEDIQRIPMIIRLPESMRADDHQPGSVLQQFASLVDIYPTILDFAGAEVDASYIHGQSLRPLLENRTVEWRDAVFVEFFGLGSIPGCLYTVRKGNWKYGWNSSSEDELYNLAQDPYEMNNLVNDSSCADRVREFQQLLADWMDETQCPGVRTYRASCNIPMTR